MSRSSVALIRRRLFTLLMRAFATVVLLMAAFMLALTVGYLAYGRTNDALYRLPAISILESYYLGHGNWDGVESAFRLMDRHPAPDFIVRWDETILLDPQNRILAEYGDRKSPRVGSLFEPTPRNILVPLHNGPTRIGTLVLLPRAAPRRILLIGSLLYPISLISIFLALLTILIGLLLSRRFVHPLAEVIAAAHAVSEGKLDTRVRVEGPDDLRDLSDSFNHMAAALERQEHERRDFLADVAHELRTPLTILRGRLEGILDGVYPADASQITPALEETYLLERLVEDLRLLSLAESGQLHIEQVPLHLGELARRAVDLFSAQANEKNIRLEVQDLAPNLLVMADAQRTSQVIANLLSNALRYAPQKSQVTLLIEPNGDQVRLSVSDNGPGVPETDLPNIFRRFWRGEKSRSRASGGAGLGLAIARQLVEAQDGRIEACNLPQGGLKVTISLPVAGQS